jgi:hypothetical protein
MRAKDFETQMNADGTQMNADKARRDVRVEFARRVDLDDIVSAFHPRLSAFHLRSSAFPALTGAAEGRQ